MTTQDIFDQRNQLLATQAELVEALEALSIEFIDDFGHVKTDIDGNCIVCYATLFEAPHSADCTIANIRALLERVKGGHNV